MRGRVREHSWATRCVSRNHRKRGQAGDGLRKVEECPTAAAYPAKRLRLEDPRAVLRVFGGRLPRVRTTFVSAIRSSGVVRNATHVAGGQMTHTAGTTLIRGRYVVLPNETVERFTRQCECGGGSVVRPAQCRLHTQPGGNHVLEPQRRLPAGRETTQCRVGESATASPRSVREASQGDSPSGYYAPPWSDQRRKLAIIRSSQVVRTQVEDADAFDN
ncbi:hypothetical protein BC628DRAFT_1029510 [Trametes gibbosa]|nr:hypothetical protein BC628DRAFT_1029510 [Trametes gibbosa]